MWVLLEDSVIWGKLPKNTIAIYICIQLFPQAAPSWLSLHHPAQLPEVLWFSTPLWRDRRVPPKLLNTSDRPVLLRCNAKLVDVCPVWCLRKWTRGSPGQLHQSAVPPTANANSAKHKLSTTDTKPCELSVACRRRMTELLCSMRTSFHATREVTMNSTCKDSVGCLCPSKCSYDAWVGPIVH